MPNFTGVFCEKPLDVASVPEVTTVLEGSTMVNTAKHVGHNGLARVKTYVFITIYIETFQSVIKHFCGYWI